MTYVRSVSTCSSSPRKFVTDNAPRERRRQIPLARLQKRFDLTIDRSIAVAIFWRLFEITSFHASVSRVINNNIIYYVVMSNRRS